MTGSGTGGGQSPPEGTDPEDSEKCPICLSVLSGSELAMPDSCCHVFCLRCLLTWAELQATPSCPVDRRPFTNVYRWDGHLTCVQVPIRRRVHQPEVESYCRRNSQYKIGLNSKKALRQRKVERTVDGKSKGLIRKCNDEDPSSLTRKKVRGAESCSWSPPAFVSLTTTTHEIAQSVDDEEAMLSHRVERCKTQSCVWFSPAAPISATDRTRESFHPSIRNSSAFPFGLGSSPFSSSPVSASSHFVFEGVVCAITCPRGGEKKGGRASKAAPKQTVSKRSSRGGKTQGEAAVAEPQSPQTSGASDSETSHSAPSRPSRGAKAAGKRKGKQVTNRKASGKRKAPARKKRSAEVVSSSNEEEDEDATTKLDDDTEGGQESAKSETAAEQHDHEKNGENVDDSEPVPIEAFYSEEQNESNSEKDQDEPLINDVSQENSDTQDKTDNESDEKVEIALSSLNSAPNSPDSTSGDNHSVKDEEQEGSPKQEPEDSVLWDNEKVASPKQEEMDFSDEDDNESTEGDSVEKNEVLTETEAEKEEINELKNDVMEANDSLHVDNESPRQSEQPEVVSQSVDAISKDGEAVKEEEQENYTKKRSLSEDMNEVPMDFGSPLSEHESGTPVEKESQEDESSGDKLKDEEVSKSEDKKTEEKRDKDKSPEKTRQRRSRFHSPTTSWSPKRDSKDSRRDRRSRSRERNGSPNRSTRRSRERERDGDSHRRDRSRERRRRRSRSRSRSRSRNRSHRRGDRSPAGEREERRDERRDERREERRDERREERREERRDERRDERREESPQKNERRGGWWAGGEGRKYGGGRFENGLPKDDSPERSAVDANPDWVEKHRISSSTGAPRWEDPPRGRGRGGRGGYDRGRGRGGENWSFYNQDEPSDNRWQPRNNFSGTGSGNAAPGSDAYSRFNENRGGRRKEQDPSEAMDRSGWSSASSWAVRRTLPADVQDYYSKRERGGAGGWNRQEDEQPAAAEPPKPDPQTVPGNAPVPVLVSAHPQLLHHYPALPGARGPVSVSLQPAAPYALPPSQVPVHLHTAVPLLQVPAVGAQGLPPPPPPPPPMQQGSQTAAAQPDGHSTQMTSNVGGFAKPLFPTPTKVTQVAPTSSLLPSSTTQPHHHKALADSSKKEKKQQIQEKAINEVKTAIKPYYQKNEITKEEYKEIVRKAVEKVCLSKSGEVNSGKVANLVKAYVDKYKHARKK